MLTNECLADINYAKYSVLTLYDAYERSAHGHVTLCLLKDLLCWHFNKSGANYDLSTTKTSKNDFKLTVTISVLEAEKF